MKQHLLLVDSDPESLRVTGVSLRKAGFAVTTAANGRDALERYKLVSPDLVLSETVMPDMDGFELFRRLKGEDQLGDRPFVFLTSHDSLQSRVEGVGLGADDFVSKPVYTREIVTRVKLLLDRREKERLTQRSRSVGNLADLALVDLVRALADAGRSGSISLRGRAGRRGTVWLRDGRVVDCETGQLSGEGAFYRLLDWHEGQFTIELSAVERAERIALETGPLVMEGMRRLEEFGRILEKLPSAERVLHVDYRALHERLAELPDDVNGLVRLIDGRRTLAHVLEEAEQDDLTVASALYRLHSDGIVRTVPYSRTLALAERSRLAVSVRTPPPEEVGWFADPGGGRPSLPPLPPPFLRRRQPARASPPAPPRIVRFPPKRKDARAAKAAAAPSASVPAVPPALPGALRDADVESTPVPHASAAATVQASGHLLAALRLRPPPLLARLRSPGVALALAAFLVAIAGLVAWRMTARPAPDEVAVTPPPNHPVIVTPVTPAPASAKPAPGKAERRRGH